MSDDLIFHFPVIEVQPQLFFENFEIVISKTTFQTVNLDMYVNIKATDFCMLRTQSPRRVLIPDSKIDINNINNETNKDNKNIPQADDDTGFTVQTGKKNRKNKNNNVKKKRR